MSRLDEWLFPRRCPVCLGIVVPRGEWICPACSPKLRLIRQPRCFSCGVQLQDPGEEFCAECRKRKRIFRQGICGLPYSSVPVRRMISEVKYHNARQLLDEPCRRCAEEYASFVKKWNLDCLVPVPLHSSRRRKRGFNQAEEIARRLGKVWDLPVETGLLFRSRKTDPQKELSAAQRRSNLLDAFRADCKKAEAYERVLLVDDIFTTGSTVEACSRILLDAGVGEVYVFCLAAGGR